MTITEFLLARIADREAEARELADEEGSYGWERWARESYAPHLLAECKAKRRIIDSAESFGTWEGSLGEDVLRALASIDADHPDFRDEWRV